MSEFKYNYKGEDFYKPFLKQVCVIGYIANYTDTDKPRFITGMVDELRDKSMFIKIMHRKTEKIRRMNIGYSMIIRIDKCKDETHILWKLQHDN